MNAIILCGGLSTRLGDITKSIPKILLEIGGRSILDWQLAKLKSVGITEVVLAAGHLSAVLRAEVGDTRLGIKMIYAIEETKLGTGGAIKNALKFISRPTEPTWILNGDILYTNDFLAMAQKLRLESAGIILGAKVADAATYGTLLFDEQNHLLSFREKAGENIPGYINGGLYLFTPTAQKYFPEENSFSIEYDVFPKMTDLDVYPSDSHWIDVGVPERLDWARENYKLFL